MTEKATFKILIIMGWATLIAYPINKLAKAASRYDYTRIHDADAKLLQTQNGISLFAFIFDSPVNLAIGFFCLAAANYLKKKPDTLKDIFE